VLITLIKAKRSLLRFGGSLDRIYNWLVGVFFVLDLLVQIPKPMFRGRLPEALGTAFVQTVGVAVVLFVIFKNISLLRRS
jgi:hypothetical protein